MGQILKHMGIGKKLIGNAREDKEKLEHKFPVRFVHYIQAPVLLIHGEYDETVYPEQSKKMYRTLREQRKPVEYLELKDVGYNGWDLETKIIYHEAIGAFLSEHLTGGVQPLP